MPIHDWTRVKPGIFHHFHLEWISSIANALNAGLLPSNLYALAEQVAAQGGIPDILTLAASPYQDADEIASQGAPPDRGGLALATAAPRVLIALEAEAEELAPRRRRIIVRHSSDDRIVAVLEIVSPGNKASDYAITHFVEKAVDLLYAGIHLLIVDLFPPTDRDPEGIQQLIWSQLGEKDFHLPEGQNLTLAAYTAGERKLAFIEPTAVGRNLIEMPLFFTPERYVNVPLEETYLRAFAAVPQRWRRELEPQA
ncbi:MAG: DUF4058 family protein [Planctomycetaceae bacterium]|nr:DUF4058 family protein [Planctomycetaceae bacterium]